MANAHADHAVLERSLRTQPRSTATDPLDRAHDHAAMGLLQTAREACAMAIGRDLPSIAADETRLRILVGALLLARAPEQLARVVRAVFGGQASIVAMPQAIRAARSGITVRAEGDRTAIAIDFDALSGADKVRLAARWSAEILDALSH